MSARGVLCVGCICVLAACRTGSSASSEASEPSDEGSGELGQSESLEAPAPTTIDEDTPATIAIPARRIRRFDAEGLPPGARLDPNTGTITFRPDFTQSGAYEIAVTGHGASSSKTVKAMVVVRDSIAPPEPVVKRSVVGSGFTRLVVQQKTDAYLDAPGLAGRTFDSVIVVPTAATEAARLPVILSLHGFGGAPNPNLSDARHFRIEPHDPSSTYWWGYATSLPGAATGPAPPYTLRRVLHLLSWLVRTYPGADPDRVFATGGSMGGAGALTLGLVFARHFAGIEATIAQTVPRNHRPSRIAQLEKLWGSPSTNTAAWDALDLTRMLRDEVEAREQFIFTKHGKDDPTIHFGAVVTPSPLTGKTFYETIEDEHIGHYTVWDEGAHGAPLDPVLGDGWWDQGWSRIDDPRSFLSRRAPFPAFSRSSASSRPGDAQGNGKVPFNVESGFAANASVAGDTGWGGDIAGAFNRFLRWDTTRTVDTRDKLSIPLFVVASPGTPAPQEGYPTKGDLFTGQLPIKVDVTPRRARGFQLLPGESVRWRFGTKSGVLTASADGSVTVPELEVVVTPTDLVLERATP
jgi:hypothetical protein